VESVRVKDISESQQILPEMKTIAGWFFAQTGLALGQILAQLSKSYSDSDPIVSFSFSTRIRFGMICHSIAVSSDHKLSNSFHHR
jgi:uncharacterized membrane protein